MRVFSQGQDKKPLKQQKKLNDQKFKGLTIDVKSQSVSQNSLLPNEKNIIFSQIINHSKKFQEQLEKKTAMDKLFSAFSKQKQEEQKKKQLKSSNFVEEKYSPEQVTMHKLYLENLWDYRYWRLVETAIQQDKSKNNKKQNHLGWFRVFSFLSQFQQKCIELVKIIVNDNFTQPQIDHDDSKYSYKGSGQVGIYFKDGIIIRIADVKKKNKSTKQSNKILNQKLNTNSSNFVAFTQSEGSYNSKAVKMLRQEFLSYNIMNNLVISLMIQAKNKFPTVKVPVSCLVTYMGYTAFCQGNSPCDGLQTLIHGPTGTLYQYRQETLEILRVIGDNLNLKPFKVRTKQNKIIDIPFCITAQLHIIRSPFKQLSIVKWINQQSYLYPHNQKDNIYLFPQYYILNLSKLWPLFIHSDIGRSFGYLRPQVVLSWRNPLSNSVFSNVSFEKNSSGQLQLADACKTLLQENIKLVAQLIDQGSFFLIDSHSIEELFHDYGINMKLLGYVTHKLTLNFNKKLLQIQMIVRSLKKIFYSNVRGFQNKFSIKDLFVDFLNLIFVQNKDSQRFYKEILYPQIYSYYDYQMSEYPPNIQGGGILHSICYHFGFKVKIIDYPFFQDLGKQTIFNTNHIVEIQASSKCYTLDICELKKICEGYKKKKRRIQKPSQQQNLQNIMAIKQCIAQLEIISTIYRLSTNQRTFNVGPLPESFYYAELAEVYLKIQDLENSLKYVEMSLKSIPQKHACAVKPFRVSIKIYSLKKQVNRCVQFYDKSLVFLGYHLSQTHPLAISVYNALGQQFILNTDPQKCQKIFAKALEICEQTVGYMHQSSSHILIQLSELPLPSEKVISFLLQALTIVDNINGDPIKVKKICLRISEIYYKMGMLSKALQYASRSNYWMMQIMSTQKLHEYNKVLQLCNRVPQNRASLVFLLNKTFFAYVKLLHSSHASNLYKLFVSLQNFQVTKQKALSRIQQKFVEEKLKDVVTILDIVKNTFSLILSKLPQLLKKKQFYRDVYKCIPDQQKKIKHSLQIYSDIISIIGIEKMQQIFNSHQKVF